MTLTPSVVTPRPNPAVYAAEVNTQRVLFNSSDRRLHVLNSSAGAIWDGLSTALTVGELANVLSDRFGVDALGVRADVERALDQFRADGLVEISESRGAATVPRYAGSVPDERVAFSVAALDAVVGIASPDPEVLEALQEIFAPLYTTRQATTSLTVSMVGDADWTVRVAGEAPVAVGSRLAALLRAIAEVNNIAVASVPDSLVFHAGAVSSDSGVALLPAASNHGKSTLTAGLVSDGLGYLTDEAAAVSVNLTCRAFPKSIALDPGAFPLFPKLAPSGSGGLAAALRGREWHIDPARLGATASSGEVRVVVCPHWRAGASTRLSRCPPTEALHLLIGQAFDFTAGGQSVFDRLGRLVDTVPVYRLGYSDLSEGVAAVRSLLDDPWSVPA